MLHSPDIGSSVLPQPQLSLHTVVTNRVVLALYVAQLRACYICYISYKTGRESAIRILLPMSFVRPPGVSATPDRRPPYSYRRHAKTSAGNIVKNGAITTPGFLPR